MSIAIQAEKQFVTVARSGDERRLNTMTRQVFVCLLLLGFVPAVARPADPGPHKNLPEMEPLKQWAGSWESSWKLDKKWDFKETAKAEWVMDGFFLQTTYSMENTTLPQKTRGMVMMTYDLSEKSFRRWEFASNGGRLDSLGTWDKKTRTMTWTHQTPQVKVVTTEKFTDDDTIAWHQVMKNQQGEVISEALGEKKRRKPQQ
jgi:hypothetical protein